MQKTKLKPFYLNEFNERIKRFRIKLIFLTIFQFLLTLDTKYFYLKLFFFLILETLPDALATGCTKCNDNQKEVAEKVIRFLMKNRTKDWERLTNKYDPNGAYKKRYEQRVGPLFS